MKISRLLLLSGLWLLVAASCLRSSPTPTPRVRDFSIEELLIDVSVFPPGWRVVRGPGQLPYEIRPRGVEDHLYIQFSPERLAASATHQVYQFRSEGTAAEEYRRVPPMSFYNADRITRWKAPKELQYQSPVADQFRFECADFHGGYPRVRSKDCIAMGRYDEYISIFSLSVSPPEDMTEHMALLERILKVIDERMAHYLGKESE